jgi:hypothetical protein
VGERTDLDIAAHTMWLASGVQDNLALGIGVQPE